MKVLSLFSGVGGFDMGLENAGMETVFQCEWDKHCRTILDHHWPTVPKWDDVSTLTGEHILAHAPVIDVVAWGSPCQDLSVAGKRAGLEGGRSGLFYEGIRIINELRKASNGKYPRISIWENVYGAINSNKGEDFEAILKEMVEAGSLLCEWRVLDAQYFGVPQRRRRVFVVAVFDSATANRCPDPLLPVSEGLRWHPTTRTETRESSAGTASAGFRNGSFGGWTDTHIAETLKTDHSSSHPGTLTVVEPSAYKFDALSSNSMKSSNPNSGCNEVDVASTLDTWRPDPSLNQGGIAIVEPLTVGALAARDYKGVGNQYVQENKCVVETFTKSRRAQSATDDETWVEGKPAPTLNSFDQGDVRATTVIVNQPMLLDGTRVDDVRVYESPVQTLQARMGTGGNNVPMVAFSHTQGLDAQPSEKAWPTLRKEGNGHAVAIPIQEPLVFQPGTMIRLNGGVWEGTVPTLRAEAKRGDNEPHIQIHNAKPTMAVRRLTPLECERLMGWPDDHTRHKADGTEQADTHRYKQCGNGVASPVAEWIGEQLRNL